MCVWASGSLGVLSSAPKINGKLWGYCRHSCFFLFSFIFFLFQAFKEHFLKRRWNVHFSKSKSLWPPKKSRGDSYVGSLVNGFILKRSRGEREREVSRICVSVMALSYICGLMSVMQRVNSFGLSLSRLVIVGPPLSRIHHTEYSGSYAHHEIFEQFFDWQATLSFHVITAVRWWWRREIVVVSEKNVSHCYIRRVLCPVDAVWLHTHIIR